MAPGTGNDTTTQGAPNMSSNRLKLLLLSVMAVIAISAIASASASAACLKVAVAGTGHWTTNACTVAGPPNEYVKTTTPITQIKPGEWCAKVETGEPSTYEDDKCENAKAGGGYIKVIAMCYPVAVAETGNFASSVKCEKNEPTTKGAWVSIEKLEKEVSPGIWCAKVKVAKTGTYKNAACTEAEAKGEFIKVKVSLDEWEVCEKGGTEEWSEHKCNAGKGTGEWSWKVLAAGETRKVVSEGGEFKLTSGTKVITCKKVKDEGTITGGKPGTDLASTITFTECTTSQAGCNVKSAGGTLKTIVVTKIPTKLQQFLVGEEEILGDIFEQKMGETVKEFVTLQFEGTCSEFPETKVKGDVVAEVVPGTGELNFPLVPIEITPHLESFGIKATLTGKDTQAVVQAFTETVAQGWAVRAS
jgi:hypothetical protein